MFTAKDLERPSPALRAKLEVAAAKVARFRADVLEEVARLDALEEGATFIPREQIPGASGDCKCACKVKLGPNGNVPRGPDGRLRLDADPNDCSCQRFVGIREVDGDSKPVYEPCREDNEDNEAPNRKAAPMKRQNMVSRVDTIEGGLDIRFDAVDVIARAQSERDAWATNAGRSGMAHPIPPRQAPTPIGRVDRRERYDALDDGADEVAAAILGMYERAESAAGTVPSAPPARTTRSERFDARDARSYDRVAADRYVAETNARILAGR